MLLRYLSAAAVALRSVNAFQNASPFFLYSTSQLDASVLSSANVGSAETVEAGVPSILKDCPSDTYVVVHQPGVSVNDISQSSPHLRRRLSGEDGNVKSTVTVSNLAGPLHVSSMRTGLESQCKRSGSWKEITLDGDDGLVPSGSFDTVFVMFSEPPANKADRESALLRSDSYINSLLSGLESYTVIYTTSPAKPESYAEPQHADQYEMDEPYPSGMKIDLKRDLGIQARASNSTNPQANLALFEKYQFLSGGIFMGGLVAILLFSILYVAISAIAGLEVSYMAFSKEMGPAAQRKQQQQQQ